MDEKIKEELKKKYRYVGDLKNGFAAVELGNKWGFVNEEGKEVVPLKYDGSCWGFENGFAVVVLEGVEFKVDTTGNEIHTAESIEKLKNFYTTQNEKDLEAIKKAKEEIKKANERIKERKAILSKLDDVVIKEDM